VSRDIGREMAEMHISALEELGIIPTTPGAAEAMAEIGGDLGQIVDLIKRVDREDAIALLRQTLTVERSAGFMDGMKHMDGVTRKTLDAMTSHNREAKP
jgi:hypothetical protein